METQDPAARRTPVLLVHGWNISGVSEAYDFDPIFSKRPEYHQIYVDLPGMGKAPIGNTKDLDGMLERLATFVEKNVLPDKFLLIGSSCGAYLARALAYKYASHIEGLLLRVPVVEPVSEKRDVDPFVPAIADETLMASLSEDDRKDLGNVTVQTPEYIDILRRKLDVVLPDVAACDQKALDSIRNDPDRYRLTAPMHTPGETFDRPTLIVTGRQDTDTGYRNPWRILPCYPRASFVVLDRADHGLPIDQTGLFAALVGDWLERVEEVRRSNEWR